jgi:hypothetical protein
MRYNAAPAPHGAGVFARPAFTRARLCPQLRVEPGQKALNAFLAFLQVSSGKRIFPIDETQNGLYVYRCRGDLTHQPQRSKPTMNTDLNATFAAVDALGTRATYLDCRTAFAECSKHDDEACWAIFEAANAWAVATDTFVKAEYDLETYRVHLMPLVPRWFSPLV